MVGPLAYGIGTDPVAVAKVLNDFAKGNEKFVITGGAMPGQVMSAKDVAALASLPSREELIAKLLGTMQAPIVEVRPHAERGAGQVRARPRGRAGCQAGAPEFDRERRSHYPIRYDPGARHVRSPN